MTGARHGAPDVPSVRVLLAAARSLGGAHGLLLELCILTLGLPWEMLAIEIEAIDHAGRHVRVPARGGRTRILHLPPGALEAIGRMADVSGGSGQAVTGGRGPRLDAASVRLDRLRSRLAQAVPASAGVTWDFHSLRQAGLQSLERRGVYCDDLLRLLGRGCGVGRSKLDHLPEIVAGQRERAAAAIATWEDILEGRQGS